MMQSLRHGPGRPSKYGRASRAITVTLPEDVLARLRTVDADLGRAIVALAERTTKRAPRAARPAEVSPYGSHAVILVKPARTLKRLPGVQLVPVGNGRALISLESARSISDLELDLRDAMDRRDVSVFERQTLEAIGKILREARRSGRVSTQQRTIIVLESKRPRRRPRGTGAD